MARCTRNGRCTGKEPRTAAAKLTALCSSHYTQHTVLPEPQTDLAPLLADCARGREPAFARLYRLCAPKLYAVALRILKREALAQEVLQESFVRIWRHAGEFQAQKASPMTWMIAIVRNCALDLARRPHYEEAVDEERLESLAADLPGPLEQAIRGSEAKALMDCLEQLDRNQRQSILLAFYEGLTHAELAARLREPLGTVKSWVRRGLARLKDCLPS